MQIIQPNYYLQLKATKVKGYIKITHSWWMDIQRVDNKHYKVREEPLQKRWSSIWYEIGENEHVRWEINGKDVSDEDV